ncbi:Glb-27p [Globodera pallida]|nr:Glb-27p [Globodera pallida]
MLSPSCSSPVRCPTSSSTILADSSTLCQKRLLDSTAPNRRPSAGPPTPSWTDSTTTTATAAASLARSSRRRRHSCSQWRSNTYSGTDQCRGSIEATGDDCHAEAGGTAATTPTTILRLRDAMRELARPQMQLCLGSPPSSCNSTLSVATVGVGQKRRQRRPSGGKPSPTSPPHGALQQQLTLLTLTAATGGGATTTRSASVCYLPSAQQISRRCSTTTRSGRLERSNSLVAGRGSATLAFLPELNPQQVANLRRTWKHINTKGLYDIIRRSFRKVESANPSVALAFRHNGISSPPPTADGTKQLGAAAAAAAASETNSAAGSNGNLPQTKYCGVMEHSKYFMVLLNRIIDGDPQEQDLERELKQIGARHVTVYKRFGVGVTAIERTGEALAESLFKLDGIRQSKETTKVWRVLIAKIVDHIETGFTDELRSQRRQTSTALLSSAAGALAAPLFDNKFVKRNSVPSPHNHKSSVRSASNEERDDDHGGSPTATPSSKAPPPPSDAPYHQQQQQQQSTSSSGSCFLSAELAGVVRRLSNL